MFVFFILIISLPAVFRDQHFSLYLLSCCSISSSFHFTPWHCIILFMTILQSQNLAFFSLYALALHYIIYDHTSISEPRFGKEDHDAQKITAVCISNLRTIFRFPGDRQQPAKATRRREFHCLYI